MAGNQTLILPIWLGLTREDVLAYSPPLADKFALNADAGLDDVVRQLVEVIRPGGSTLVVARDFLIDKGFEPPVVTDDWWLDVAAAAESNGMEGIWRAPMGWGRWGFPLPDFAPEPAQLGVRLGWAALQQQWLHTAEQRPITQITPPHQVLEFIDSQTGLAEMCAAHPYYLTAYAPQLVIPGCAGPFEDTIDDMYRRSVDWYTTQASEGSSFGTGITQDRRNARCAADLALRDPEFGGYQPEHVAAAFVQGDAIANGPPVKYHGTIDYLAWLLSANSRWLGDRTRDFLTLGMARWSVWTWDGGDHRAHELGYEIDERTHDPGTA